MALARCLVLAALGLALVPAATLTAEGAPPRAPMPVGVEVLRERPYAGPGGPVLDAYVHPRARRPRPALLVVHGGSWVSGDKRNMAGVARAAAARGLAVFNVNYTLALPGRPGFPGQHSELREAVRWIRVHAERLNVDPERIGALGTSAGGHLAALLATAGDGPRSAGGRIAAAVTWSAPTTLDGLDGWLGLAVRNLLGCLAEACGGRAVAASPVTHATPDDPPMLIVHSEHEIVPVHHALGLAESLRGVGVATRLRLLAGDRHGRSYAHDVLNGSLRFLVRRLTP